MNPENGGQSNSDDLQRQAASVIARKKVIAAYSDAAQKSYENHTDNASNLKGEKINPLINSESWNRYHTAWQNYYQKYYSDYYSRAAQDYINRERLKDEREKEEEKEIIVGKRTAEDKLRSFIRKKATDSAKKTRRHRKIIPILAGVFVALFILFLQYNRLIFAPIMAYVSPGNVPAAEIDSVDPTVTRAVSPEPKLIIPKLNVDVPVHFGITLSEVDNAMLNGVAHYRIAGADAYPGEIGNLVITGHSAGDVYNSNPYKFIFSGLERLENGDLIYINYESVRYTYRVFDRKVVEPTDVAALIRDEAKPMLTLVTCTPLGTSRYRLLLTAEQISPDYDTDSIAHEPSETDIETTEMPSNEPSFFEGIWNWLTGQN
jgi:sortase A